MAERFEKHARTFTLLTLVSRVTGLARDAAISRVFGATALMDAFWFAFMVPNLFRRLFGEGALSAAFLPVYTRLDKSDPLIARRLASLTISLLVVVLGGVTLIGEIVLAVILARSDTVNPAVWLMMIMLPYMPLVCVVALLGAMLQVHGRFGPTAAAPIVLNLSLVAAAAGLQPFFPGDGARALTHVGWVAAAVLLAGVAQVIWSLWSLRSLRWWTRERDGAREPFRDVLVQAGPMFLGLGVLQLNTFVDGLIASYPTSVGPTIFGVDFPLEQGAMASLSYAQRLYEFPLGVFGIAVATAIFPSLARTASDALAFTDILRRGLRLVVFIGLPASAGLILVREPLTAVILQGGDFTPGDTRRVAFILMGYAPAIWAYSMTHTLTRAFYAKGDSMTPVKVAVGMVALNFALNASLIWTPLKEAGLAWSTATCAIVQVMILLRLIRRHAPGAVDGSVTRSWGRTVLITLVMTGAVVGVTAALGDSGARWRDAIMELAVTTTTGALVVATMARLLRMPELRWAIGRSGAV